MYVTDSLVQSQSWAGIGGGEGCALWDAVH